MSFPKSRYIRIYVMGYGCNHILSYKKVGSDMSYVALYRKWRPDTFDEVKGQDHIVTTLRNQIILWNERNRKDIYSKDICKGM